MIQNEFINFIDSIYIIWLSKYVDSDLEDFLIRNFCSRSRRNQRFNECVWFYRYILGELASLSRGDRSMLTYLGNGVYRRELLEIGGYLTFSIVHYDGIYSLYIIDLVYPIPIRSLPLLREKRISRIITETINTYLRRECICMQNRNCI